MVILADVALPDLSRPPPNFAANTTPPPPAIPPLMSLPPPDFLPDDLLPSLPYYDLPAGLMVPLVKVSNVPKKGPHKGRPIEEGVGLLYFYCLLFS